MFCCLPAAQCRQQVALEQYLRRYLSGASEIIESVNLNRTDKRE